MSIPTILQFIKTESWDDQKNIPLSLRMRSAVIPIPRSVASPLMSVELTSRIALEGYIVYLIRELFNEHDDTYVRSLQQKSKRPVYPRSHVHDLLRHIHQMNDAQLVDYAERILSALVGQSSSSSSSSFSELDFLLSELPTDELTLRRMVAKRRNNMLEAIQMIDTSHPHLNVNENANGLKFDDHVIVQKLSGPVSMRVMRSEIPTLPIIILMGDVHFSRENICEPCGVHEDEDRCFTLLVNGEGTPLFEALDQTSYADQISVFVEYFDTYYDPISGSEHLFVPGFDNGVMQDVVKEAIPCVANQRNLLSSLSSSSICSTNHLKWHMADVRFSGVTVESAFSVLWHLRLDYHKYNLFWGTNQTFRKMISTIVNSLYDYNTNRVQFERFAESFANEVLKPEHINYSLIAKQLQKQPLFRVTPARLKAILLHAIDIQFADSVESQKKVKQLFHLAKSMGRSLGEVFFEPEFWARAREVIFDQVGSRRLSFILNISSALMDVYTVLRMMKSTRDSKLSIAFLGNAHAISIASLLFTYFGYQLEYIAGGGKMHEIEENRCLRIDQPVNIQAMIAHVDTESSKSSFSSSTRFPSSTHVTRASRTQASRTRPSRSQSPPLTRLGTVPRSRTRSPRQFSFTTKKGSYALKKKSVRKISRTTHKKTKKTKKTKKKL